MMKQSDGKALLELAVILAGFSLFAAMIVTQVNDDLQRPFRHVALSMGGGSSTTMAGEENNGRDEVTDPAIIYPGDQSAAAAVP